jgi:hypothetical protein
MEALAIDDGVTPYRDPAPAQEASAAAVIVRSER